MSVMKTLTINNTTYRLASIVPTLSVDLLASAWVKDGKAYSQVVTVTGVTPHSKVDLQPTPEQLEEFHYKILAFVAENNGGVVTIYSIGDKPTGDHTIQVTLTEVEGTGKIRGNTVGTTMPIPDWHQTDPTRADFIKNKERVADIYHKAQGKVITVDNSADAPLHNLITFGKTTQDGTPTPSNPMALVSAGNSGSITETVCGKNLLPKLETGEQIINGVKFTVNTDGSIVVNGTPTDGIARLPIMPLGKYKCFNGMILSGCPMNGGYSSYGVYIQEAGTFDVKAKDFGSGSVIEGITDVDTRIFIDIQPGYTANNVVFYPMIRPASITDSAYEPYKGQSLTLSTPNGLPGIKLGATIPNVIANSPAHMSGVYWDEETQAYWIGDTKDGASGKNVQRIRKFIPKNLTVGYLGSKVYHAEYTTADYPAKPAKANGEKADIMCDSLPIKSANDQYNYGGNCISLGTTGIGYISFDGATTLKQVNAKLAEQDVTVMYILANPIETDLTAEEKAAFAALHTNKPNTTVYNDAGAYQEIEYYTSNSALPVTGGSLGGNLNMTGHHITNVADPVDPKDAANKDYADTKTERVLLWENAAPGFFANQTLTLACSTNIYDGIEIVYSHLNQRSYEFIKTTGFIPLTNGDSSILLDAVSDSGTYYKERSVQISAASLNTEFKFGIGYKYAFGNQNPTQDNQECAPTKIYGIKGVRQ